MNGALWMRRMNSPSCFCPGRMRTSTSSGFTNSRGGRSSRRGPPKPPRGPRSSRRGPPGRGPRSSRRGPPWPKRGRSPRAGVSSRASKRANFAASSGLPFAQAGVKSNEPSALRSSAPASFSVCSSAMLSASRESRQFDWFQIILYRPANVNAKMRAFSRIFTALGDDACERHCFPPHNLITSRPAFCYHYHFATKARPGTKAAQVRCSARRRR